jgi:Uma2 family endonuclease
MTTMTLPRPANTSTKLPRHKLWTVAQFHRLGDLGLFEGTGAMLIHGEILENGPMNPPHRIALELTNEAIRRVFGRGWRICIQMPLVLGMTTDPQPDVAVIAGDPRAMSSHPSTAELIVEISDTSIRYDTIEKMSLYAAAGIREYWVLDVNSRQLIVHRDPTPDANATFGYTYTSIQSYTSTATVSPLAVPGASLLVSDLLP